MYLCDHPGAVRGQAALKARLEKASRTIRVVVSTLAACPGIRGAVDCDHPSTVIYGRFGSGADYFATAFEIAHHKPTSLRSDRGEMRLDL
jgi:hypothetical protein